MSTSLIVTRKHYANSRYGQVHVLTARPTDLDSAQNPPLVCFHPSPTSGDIYREILPYLAGTRIVHCPDTPGFGGSDGPAQKPTMDDYGAGLVDALLSLGYGPQKQVNLFGFHTGALCAVAVATQRPDLVRRIVLSGVPHYTPEERTRQRAVNVKGYPYFDDPAYVDQIYKRLVLQATDAGDLDRKFARFVDRLRAGPNGWWGPDAVFSMDTEAALPRIAAPTLLIAFNEMMTEPTRAAAKIIPNATLLEMLDLPMFGFIVAPEKVATAINAFLK